MEKPIRGNLDYYDKEILSEKLSAISYDLHYKEVMKSTMDFSFEKTGKKSLVILANHQTDGRGRYNNRWKDEKNQSLLMTIAERKPAINKMPVNLLAHLFALQVCLALKKIANSQKIKIKWPNDIMLSGQKIAGILVERKKNATLIGLGVNVYENKTAGSAYLFPRKIKFGRQIILLDILKKWHKSVGEIENDLFENKRRYYEKLWGKNSFLLNKKVFLSLKNFTLIGKVRKSWLDGNISVESDHRLVTISENDYIPGSCVIK